MSDGTPPFGVLLRRLRTAASLTQEELAERSGTSVRGISDLERGLRHAPRLETVRLLAEALAPRDGDRAALLAAARPGVVPGLPPAGGLGTPGSLPAPLTRLIGRETEAAALRARLAGDGVRLVTVTGAGGTGKTRLASEVAARARDRYADGVFFVDLSPLTDPRLVVPTIAAALGVRESGDRPLLETLSGFLAAKRVLLVLDNCERVLAAASDVAALLAACPTLVVLATSREAFHVQGEHRYPLTPLRLPEPGARPPLPELARVPAVALFVERAGAVDPGFVLTEANASQVSAICHRLDGLPLAIELAAARAQALPPPALLARLEHRLPLLAGGGHDLPARQRTMRDAVAWSHDLLPADERAVFRRLAVFSGGFTLDAADAVAGLAAGGQVVGAVIALVERSLLRPLAGPDGAPRFAMLETVREFGQELLEASGEAEETRLLHASVSAELAAAAEAELRRAGQARWLARLEAEHDNLRSALAWALSADAGLALRLAGSLHWFWYLRGHWREGRRWLDEALSGDSAQGPTPARMKALAGAGILAFALGDQAAGRAQLGESAALGRALGDPAGTAYGLHFLEMGALYVGDRAAARRLAESADLFREAGDAWGLAAALCSQGTAAIQLGDPEAGAVIGESLALARGLGDAWSLARALHYAGELARSSGEYARARAHYEESLSFYRLLGHQDGVARVLHNLGYVAQHQGDLRRAAASFAEAMAVAREHGDRWNLAHYLAGLGGTALGLGQPERAARLLGSAAARLRAAAVPPWPVDRAEHDRHRAVARARLGEAAFAAAWADGWAMPAEQALAEAAEVAAGRDTPRSLS